MSRLALGRRTLPWLASGEPTAPLIIPRVAPQFSVSTRILHGRRLLLVAIHKEHTAGPTTSINYQVGSTIHTILSFDPGAPPNCFGHRLRSSSVRQPPLLAQIDPRQPQLIIGTLCAQELPDGSEKIAAAHIKGFPYVVELFRRRQQVFQVQD